MNNNFTVKSKIKEQNIYSAKALEHWASFTLRCMTYLIAYEILEVYFLYWCLGDGFPSISHIIILNWYRSSIHFHLFFSIWTSIPILASQLWWVAHLSNNGCWFICIHNVATFNHLYQSIWPWIKRILHWWLRLMLEY